MLKSMEKNYNYYTLCILLLSLLSCKENSEIITTPSKENIVHYLLVDRNIKINEYCGVIDSLPFQIDNKTIILPLLVKCEYYQGSFNIDNLDSLAAPYLTDEVKTIEDAYHGVFLKRISDLMKS